MKINFEERFDRAILKKGFDYYRDDRVEDVEVNDNIIEATVIGNENYQVQIVVDKNNNLKEASCNCPYAQGDGDCKHVVALCYHINNNELEIKNATIKNRKKESEIKIVINKISEEDLKNYLEQKLLQDENIYNDFKTTFRIFFAKEGISEYKNKIKNAINKAAGRDGFIDYNETSEYSESMWKICEEADRYIDNQDYNLAFDIVTAILDEIPNTDIDDSDGSTGMVADDCIEIINKILRVTDVRKDKKLVDKIFKYIENELETENLSNYGVDLDDILENLIDNKLYSEILEEILKKQIKKDRKNDFRCYRQKVYVKLLIEILCEDNRCFEAEELMKKNLEDLEVLAKYVDMLVNRKEYIEAIGLMKKTILEKRDSSRTIVELVNKLLAIYQKANMKVEYKEDLYNAFFDLGVDTLDMYRKIKSLYNQKEWEEESNNIITRLEDSRNVTINSNIINIYIEEQKIDKLFNVVKNENNMYCIMIYEKYLFPKYENEIVEIYINAIKAQTIHASDRRMYTEIANNLEHVKKLINGEAKVKNLIEEFKVDYKNRPAMIEEISRV